MENLQTTKVFSGLRALFIACFCVAVICVVSVYYPLAGIIMLLLAQLFLADRWKASSKLFALFLFGGSLLIHLAVVAVVTTPIISDFSLQYEASLQFAQGDFSFQETKYFQRWGYQTGLVIWQGTLLKLWNSPLFLRLVNCVVSAGTNLLVYLIARDYFEERAARLAGMAYACFLFPATLVTVLCNNIPSAFFLYLSLYLVMGKRFEDYPRLAVYAMGGASLAVANALRPDAPLVLVPLLAYFVFRFVSQANWKLFLDSLKKFAVLLLTFLVLSTAMSGLVQVTGVNAAGLKNNDPLWSVVVGTSIDHGGMYNDDDAFSISALIEQGMERSQAELEVIKNHLRVSPVKWLELAVKKMDTLWWDSALGWSLGSIQQNAPVLYDLLVELDRAMFTCALFLAAAGSVALFFQRKKQLKLYLLPFVFFATSCVYLVMEVQPRYAYVGQIAVFIMMAGGVQELERLWNRIFRSENLLAQH